MTKNLKPRDGGAADPSADAPWDDLESIIEHKKHFFVLLFVRGVRHVSWLVPTRIRRATYDAIVSVSPDVPANLQKLTGEPDGWRIFRQTYVGALILCLGLTSLFTLMTGTFTGNASNTVYFTQDRANLFLYAFVCPIYAGFSMWLIALFLGRSAALTSFADEVGAARHQTRVARFPFTVLAMVVIAAVVVFAYISDVLRVENVPQAYWFMTAPDMAGNRYLNGAGIYYVVLNFSLMLVTAAATFCFFSMFFDTLRIGHWLRAVDKNASIEFETVATRLTTFTEAYLVTKLLCAAYIVNVVVWRLSPLGATTNVQAASFVLAAMGGFFIAFPRYYVELMWRDYRRRAGQPRGEFKDLRSPRDRIVISVVDKLFVSTFVINLLTVYVPLQRIHYGDVLLETLKAILGA